MRHAETRLISSVKLTYRTTTVSAPTAIAASRTAMISGVRTERDRAQIFSPVDQTISMHGSTVFVIYPHPLRGAPVRSTISTVVSPSFSSLSHHRTLGMTVARVLLCLRYLLGQPKLPVCSLCPPLPFFAPLVHMSIRSTCVP